MTRRAARAALLVATLALCLAVAETALRALDLPRRDACVAVADWAVPDPVLGYRGAPGSVVSGIALNDLGLRGPTPEMPKPAGRTRILFLGDSTAFGLGVGLEETFAAVAVARLAASQPGRSIDFVDGAFPGYSTYHSSILLEQLLPLAPDLVVLYVGARNDEDRAREFSDAEIPARHARLDRRWHRLRLGRLAEAAVDGIARRLRALRGAAGRARVPPDAFRANLLEIADRLRDASIPLLVVLPPISPVFEQRLPLVRSYRDVLVGVARERGLPLVSLDDRFAAGDPEQLFFEDQFHLAAPGHAIAGEEIASAVSSLGLLDSADAPREDAAAD